MLPGAIFHALKIAMRSTTGNISLCKNRATLRGGDGLIRWTERDRPIDNTDVVLWYTFGHTHIPRPEDYPVMPTAYIGFTLKPNGFFSMNPANDVPPSEKKEKKSCCH